jgi:STE24 endopeptidase
MMINLIAMIILAVLVAELSLELIGNWLNLKALKLELPTELHGIFKPQDYSKSQEYLRVTTRFSLLGSGFNLFLLLAFWFLGGFNWFDQIVRGWNFIPLISGLFYIGILLLAFGFLKLPFSIYGTFVIEKRFGFNRTTPRTFFLDQVKGLIIALILGGLLLGSGLALFQYVGNYAWLFCWSAVTIFSLVIQYVAPIWIMPLFNKFTPMEPGELKEAILNMPVLSILLLPMS